MKPHEGHQARRIVEGLTPATPRRELGPKQIDWCRQWIGSFDDAERRATQAREETARMRAQREAA